MLDSTSRCRIIPQGAASETASEVAWGELGDRCYPICAGVGA